MRFRFCPLVLPVLSLVLAPPIPAAEPPGPGIAGVLPAASRASLADNTSRVHLFADPGFYHWGGTPVKGEDGLYHLFYDRWPRGNPRGMFGWLYISQIARATANKPEGPYEFREVALSGPGDSPPGRWDAVNRHNAYGTRLPDPATGKIRYFLYFIANRGGKSMEDEWLVHVGNQRIGVAISDHPSGPWETHPRPVIEPDGPLQHYVVNPGVTRLPDGRFLMVLKGRGSKADGTWGPMRHGWALAERPEGPFRIQPTLLFPDSVSAEDPCVWVQDGRVFAAVKDWNGKLSGVAPGVSWVYADLRPDGALEWKIPSRPLISARKLPPCP